MNPSLQETPKPYATVSELIAALSQLDGASPVMASNPPFDGVHIIPQGDGGVMIARMRENIP